MCVLLMNRNEGNLFVLLLYVLALLIVLCIYLLLHFYVKTKVFLTRRANVVTEGGRQEEGSIGNMWVYNTICYSRKCSVCTVILTSVVKSQCTPEACCIWNESEWVVVLCCTPPHSVPTALDPGCLLFITHEPVCCKLNPYALHVPPSSNVCSERRELLELSLPETVSSSSAAASTKASGTTLTQKHCTSPFPLTSFSNFST